ncbi:MAG: glucose-6-phosphate isomerase, partial [Paludibacteraceae bacterium]
MENIKLNIENAFPFVSKASVDAYEAKVKESMDMLHKGTGKGNDFLGWLSLPSSITEKFMDEVVAVANDLRSRCEVVVVAGIGGSYLGARSVIDALSNSFGWLQQDSKNPVIVFAGNNIGEDYLAELTAYLSKKQFGIINISKSGTTTETAIAFRILKTQLEKQVGKA